MRIFKINEWYGIHEANNNMAKSFVDDFFELMDMDPGKETFATAYYVCDMNSKFNKFYIDASGNKDFNPMIGRGWKLITYQFNFGRSYSEAVGRKNPTWLVQQRNTEVNKVDGYKMIEFDKNGNMKMPIADFKVLSTKFFYLEDDGTYRETSEAEFKPYYSASALKPRPSSGSGVNFVALFVDKIVRLSAKKCVWMNPYFKYKDILPYITKYISK